VGIGQLPEWLQPFAIGLGFTALIVVPLSAIVWFTRRRSLRFSPPNLTVITPPKHDHGGHGEHGAGSAADFRDDALRELTAKIDGLRDSLPSYIAKNLLWAIVGAVIGLVAQSVSDGAASHQQWRPGPPYDDLN
jgi:hypothetical protein